MQIVGVMPSDRGHVQTESVILYVSLQARAPGSFLTTWSTMARESTASSLSVPLLPPAPQEALVRERVKMLL